MYTSLSCEQLVTVGRSQDLNLCPLACHAVEGGFLASADVNCSPSTSTFVQERPEAPVEVKARGYMIGYTHDRRAIL